MTRKQGKGVKAALRKTARLCLAAVGLVALLGARPACGQRCVGDCDAGGVVDVAEIVRGGGGECAGDCNANGVVDVAEVILGIDILLGELDLASCPSIDEDQDDRVRIDEILSGVINALEDCSP
jgi:hypothetical protein